MGALHAHRARLHLVAVSALALVVVVVVIAAITGRSESAGPADDRSPFAGAVLPDGVRAPAFTLRDQDDRIVRMADYRGRIVVAAFVYSTCEESCGPQMQLIRGALDDLGRDIPALAISVEPEGDTALRARRFLFEQRMTGRARYVLGSPAQMAPVHRGFFVQPQTDEAEHQARIVLIDAAGRQRVGYSEANSTSEQIAHDIRVLEREERASRR